MRVPSRLIRGQVRPDRNSLRRFASLRWAALPIVDRRWTAPMSAIALGFGLFIGVAIGPGTQGSFGTTKPMVIRVPAPTQTAEAPQSHGGSRSSGHQSSPSGPTSTPSSPPPSSTPSPPDFNAPNFDTPSVPSFPTPPSTTPYVPPATTTSTTSTTTTTTTTDTTTTFTGTVVHLNPHAASYTLATADGRLVALHSHTPPTMGKSVEVDGRRLANGTYSEVGNRSEHGTKGRATFDGTVSFSDPVDGVYTVSAPGVSLAVRGGLKHGPPRVGARVELDAKIADHPEDLPVSEPGDPGCGQAPPAPKPPNSSLEQVKVTVTDDARAASTDVEGIVEGVCRNDRKLIVSADDLRESGHDVSIAVPSSLKISPLKNGQVLKLSASIGDSGALSLSTVAGDEGAHGAEDTQLVQP